MSVRVLWRYISEQIRTCINFWISKSQTHPSIIISYVYLCQSNPINDKINILYAIYPNLNNLPNKEDFLACKRLRFHIIAKTGWEFFIKSIRQVQKYKLVVTIKIETFVLILIVNEILSPYFFIAKHILPRLIPNDVSLSRILNCCYVIIILWIIIYSSTIVFIQSIVKK